MSESWQLGSRYTLERQIGSGAMGQVWVGHDVDGHTLAFKLLRPELADDPGVVARFLQERNLLVGLRSPYVIRVHDLVVEGPRLAIVMDYVAGDSLRALLQGRGNLPPHDVATLGAQIAQGLAAVHGAGVLHRDLKPENVLLADDPDAMSRAAMSRATTETVLPAAAASTPASTDALGALVPRLADFGVASLVTQTGQVATANVIGTPQYLAPELGDGQPSGRAGDLYALGVTLYEMACGAVPFHADSPVALLRLHADHAPTRPDGIPDALWVLIAALLAKNPHERPDDAAAVAQRLWAMAPQFAGAPAAPVLSAPPRTSRIVAAGASESAAPIGSPVPMSGAAAAVAAPAAAGGAVGAGGVGGVAGPGGANPADHLGTASATSDTPSGGQHRRSVWLAVTLVAGLALIALVAWLLLRDSSSSHGAAPAPSSSTSSRSAQPRDVPLSGALSGGARTASVRVGGSSYDDAVVPLLTDRQACTAAAQFALDRRYDEVAFTVGATDAQPGGTNMQPEGTTTVTVRVDGSAKQTVTLGGKQAKTLRVPVSGARTLSVDTDSIGCSPALDTAPVTLVAGTLRTS
ncbi:serine/threonine-protein kinase [Dermacoccus nishinomiyaensis]|uniref:serine/threonine-protein kinase n=1 Tax=Dermacoccus nishinomiyaensis TaxID=1274 RepID=UPI0011A13A27|nr:serine/threonine-protein kinase [Dermacoccus nishinomiyaensis]MCT1604266.1 serine/threonine protein kinase [Dermacoccus nishinomiyaensis]